MGKMKEKNWRGLATESLSPRKYSPALAPKVFLPSLASPGPGTGRHSLAPPLPENFSTREAFPGVLATISRLPGRVVQLRLRREYTCSQNHRQPTYVKALACRPSGKPLPEWLLPFANSKCALQLPVGSPRTKRTSFP